MILSLILALLPVAQSWSKAIAHKETLQWCEKFVVAHNLCPYAAASLDTLQILPTDSPMETLKEATREFENLSESQIMTAITFVVLEPCAFADFYDWFMDVEDEWLENYYDVATLAAFHPDWQYGDDEMAWDKRAPYPTVSVVSAQAMDQLGSAATKAIASTNAVTLQSKSAEEWRKVFEKAVYGSTEEAT